MNPQTLKLAAVAVAAAALFGAGWAVNGWRLGTAMATERTHEAEAHAKALSDALAQRDAAAGQRDALQAQLAANDAAHTATLRSLTDENNSLRGAVAAGARVVRIRGAVCPSAPGVPQAPAGGGVDSGTGAILDAQAGQAVLDFRGDAIRVGEKLAACQDAVRAMTGQ